MPHRGDYGDMDNGWGLFMVLGMVAIWVVLAVILWMVISSTRSKDASASPRPTTPNAEQILGERLARGEIDAEEYRTRMDALRAHRDT